MTRLERFQFVIRYFEEHAPDAGTELRYHNPYQLLVAVILSAQCTDKRVNLVTPALFERFPDFKALSRAREERLFPLVKSISYPNSKTRHLIGMANMVMETFVGKLPRTQEELMQLPGVGRKTANVLLSVLYQQPKMAVDTHVFRVSRRIGLTVGARTPLQAEQQLMERIPLVKISVAHHWLILHGRYICLARNPKCGICPIREACKYASRTLPRT